MILVQTFVELSSCCDTIPSDVGVLGCEFLLLHLVSVVAMISCDGWAIVKDGLYIDIKLCHIYEHSVSQNYIQCVCSLKPGRSVKWACDNGEFLIP